MKLDHKGLLIVISGPSGVGKGTVREKLFKDSKNPLVFSISMTTRAIRDGEVDGKDYYFVSHEEFERRISEGKFLEYAKFVSNYYGTPLDLVEDRLKKGEDVVLEIETKGAMQVKEKMPEAVLIFILPPSIEELSRRLYDRGTETKDVIEKRLGNALNEIGDAMYYDYVVVNDDASSAAMQIEEIINSVHAKTNRCLNNYNDILKGDK